MSAKAINDGHGKDRMHSFRVTGEIGLWLSIILLITAAVLHGISDIAKIKGDAGAMAAFEAWVPPTFWVALPMAVVGYVLMRLYPTTIATEEEASAS